MPWINLTVRRGVWSAEQQDAAFARMTDTLMAWENVPDTPAARAFTKGWVYEVNDGADYVGGAPHSGDPSYFLEIRSPPGALDATAKRGVLRDLTTIVLQTEGAELTPQNLHRVWITITEVDTGSWSIGGHTDWSRSYVSRLDPDN